MPKKPVRNAFFFYMEDFRNQEQAKGIKFPNGMKDVAIAAADSWKSMDAGKKSKYEERAKRNKEGGKKFTTLGEPYDELERISNENRQMKIREEKDINNIVKLGTMNNTIISEVFYIIDVNFYCRTVDCYVPCEVAICAFNLENGIEKIYHTFVDPVRIPVGYLSDAKASFENHNTPLPPLEYGESDFIRILSRIIDFLKADSDVIPPLFTTQEKMAPVLSFLNQMCDSAAEDPNIFRVYNIHKFYFSLINEIKTPGWDGLPKESLALVQINKDVFEFTKGLACEIHEDTERFYNCCKARVKRLAFIILDHCCQMVGVKLIPGCHVPVNIDIEASATPHGGSTSNVHNISGASMLSGYSGATADSKAAFTPVPITPAPNYAWGGRGSIVSGGASVLSQNDFPALAPLRKPHDKIARPAPKLSAENLSIGRGRGTKVTLAQRVGSMKIGD